MRPILRPQPVDRVWMDGRGGRASLACLR